MLDERDDIIQISADQINLISHDKLPKNMPLFNIQPVKVAVALVGVSFRHLFIFYRLFLTQTDGDSIMALDIYIGHIDGKNICLSKLKV